MTSDVTAADPIRPRAAWWRTLDPAIAAGATLLLFMAGHAMRETARDTLFLMHLPASRLPWAYLAIAATTLAFAALGRERLARIPNRTLLASVLVVSVAVDLGFWWIAPGGSAGTLFGLYVWTGLVATAVTVLFWLHLADRFDVGEAKRSFALVAAGGLAGAAGGSALAGVLLRDYDTRVLLLGSSAFSIAAAGLVIRVRAGARLRVADVEPASWRDTRRALFGDAYLARILALSALVAMLGTGIDFLFKSTVASEVERAELGPFFARFNGFVNAAALLLQLLVAPALLRAIGVTRSIAVLPSALLLGSAAAAAIPGLLPLALLKGADGTLRHSLYRAGTEILYLPLPPRVRGTFKTIVDSVGQRGGQALASLAILLAVRLHAAPRVLAAALLGVAVLAIGALLGLRRDYVARFRDQLRSLGPVRQQSMPPLELHSLEVIASSLSSPDDAEVLSALDLLEDYDKRSLVSPLILHHPSAAVVLRALELLAGSDHPHLGPQIEALLAHRDPAVRAAALHHHAARGSDAERLLRVVREDRSSAVRATALLLWIGPRDRDAVSRLVREILDSGDRDARMALARALPALPLDSIGDAPQRLVADPEYAAEIAQSVCAAPKVQHVPLLLELLARREARAAARAALLALGDGALVALAAALDAEETSEAVRRHLPRTISRFANADAAATLVRAAERGDARISYKALRGLGRLRTNDPDLPIASEPIERVADAALRRAVTMLHYRVAHAAWCALHPPASQDADLLGPLLIELEWRALEHVFRALHVLDPEQEYGLIFDALQHGRAYRAGSREVLEHLVEGSLRDGLLAVLDPGTPLERLRSATRFVTSDGAERLLELLRPADDPAAFSREQRDRLDIACRAVFAAIVRDPDPVLVSVARHRLHLATREHRHVA